MKKALILSIPHTGSHFVTYLCNVLLGVETQFGHFEQRLKETIRQRLIGLDPRKETVVIPWRPAGDVKKSWTDRMRAGTEISMQAVADRLIEYHQNWDCMDELMPLLLEKGFVMFPIPKTPLRWAHVESLCSALDVFGVYPPKLSEFINEWPRIRSWDPDKGVYRQDGIPMSVLSKIMSENRLKLEIPNGT